VLLDGNDVVAVIDFTPYHEPALFAFSTALYWYHVFGKPDGADLSGSRLSLESYSRLRPWDDPELAVWPAMLVRESLRRFALPLAVAEGEGGEPARGSLRRYAAVVAAVRSLPELSARSN
jgi:Ser/Thr protein kinase RdoA (MazF antagonist)